MTVELRSIHKHFGHIRANDGIDLVIRPGTIHGILGENGAGKSTLMKVLAGFIPKTSGTVCVDGRPVEYADPGTASSLGIGMLYQDPLDFPQLTVLENFMAGYTQGAVTDRKSCRSRLAELNRYLGFDLDPDAVLGRLTVGERQQLELMRLLASGRKVLVLDEPTTGISSIQKDILFAALRRLAGDGSSVVVVSHKLDDVMTLCDEVTVLRRGRVVLGRTRPFSSRELLETMFGTEPAPPLRKGHEPGAQALFVDGVHARGGRSGLTGCTCRVCRGEVVGLAGLEGSGQELFLRVACGLVRPTQGRVHISRRDMTGKDYHAFVGLKVAFQPSSRLEEGLIRGLTVKEHCALVDPSLSFTANWGAAAASAWEKIRAFRVAATPDSLVESLSGGNQQRLLLSFLPEDADLLLLENPTRGLDMESARRIWERIDSLASKGTAVVFSSSELDEILAVADRVLVFFEGRMIVDIRTEDIDTMALGRAIAGKV